MDHCFYVNSSGPENPDLGFESRHDNVKTHVGLCCNFRCKVFQACISLSKVCDGVKDCLYEDTDEEEANCKAVQPNLGRATKKYELFW